MSARKYTNSVGKSISFGKDFNLSFEQFKKEFEETHIFNYLKPKERAEELKKAFKIATSKVESNSTEESK